MNKIPHFALCMRISTTESCQSDFINAPHTVHAYINDCLWLYIDDCTESYIDEILIYLTNKKEHEEHIQNELQWLRKYSLFTKAQNLHCRSEKIVLLRFVMCIDGIAIELNHISTISDWPTRQSVVDMHVLFEFTNICLQFIRKYSKLPMRVSHLLAKVENFSASQQVEWEWMPDAELAFARLQ